MNKSVIQVSPSLCVAIVHGRISAARSLWGIMEFFHVYQHRYARPVVVGLAP